MDKKILLLLDSCDTHSENVVLTNIKFSFFSPNMTSILQPLDVEVICNAKTL